MTAGEATTYPISPGPSKYSLEFQERAVRLAAARTPTEAAVELGILPSTLTGWLYKAHRELYLSLLPATCDLCGKKRPPLRGTSHGRNSFCSAGCASYASSLRRHYNLSVTDYRAILDAQEAGCAICGDTPKPHMPSRGLHVDHCHTTGQVRALLCQGCNHMLGGARDRPDLLESGAAYLRERYQLRLVA